MVFGPLYLHPFLLLFHAEHLVSPQKSMLLCSNTCSAAIPQLAAVCLFLLKTEKDKMKLNGTSDPHLVQAQLYIY